MIKYISKAKITWNQLKELGMSRDKGGRWFPSAKTPTWVAEYLEGYRTPSRAWPNSYATALMSQKFAKLLVEKAPALAVALNVAEGEG